MNTIAEKMTKSQKKERINQLLEMRDDVGVKLMNMSLVKGSPEHKSLRSQFISIRDELKELGANTDQHSINKEDMEEAAKIGAKKKKERKAKKDAKKETKTNYI